MGGLSILVIVFFQIVNLPAVTLGGTTCAMFSELELGSQLSHPLVLFRGGLVCVILRNQSRPYPAFGGTYHLHHLLQLVNANMIALFGFHHFGGLHIDPVHLHFAGITCISGHGARLEQTHHP